MFREAERAIIRLHSTVAKTATVTKSTPRTAQHHTARLTAAGVPGRSGLDPMCHAEREQSTVVESVTTLQHSTVASRVLRMLSKPRNTPALLAQLTELGAVGENGRNRVPLAEATDISRERGSATIQLQPTTEETVMAFLSKRDQFLFRDAPWMEDGMLGAHGRSAASPVGSVEFPRDPEDATYRSQPMEENSAVEIPSRRNPATAHHARLMVVGPVGASGPNAA